TKLYGNTFDGVLVTRGTGKKTAARPPGRISDSPRPARHRGEPDNRTCSGRDGAGLSLPRNPGVMLSVVP
ncbi:hypothetical protein, partial [Streptomyces sp. NPDC005568]|uniref:hypothetical protein n=1 Tax=Streptomyces sp. NPDC005568 TaxID=3156887 RepID=UPI0033A64444